MRTLIALVLALAPTLALADPPPTITPSCSQFGTETGYMCSFTRRIDLSWVCTEFGYSTSICGGAYVDCQVKLIWWETAGFGDAESSVSCDAPVLGT